MNKKLLSLPLMMLLAVGLVSASPFNYNSLVLYLPFEEGSGTTAGDQSGSGHDGTLTGDVDWVATGIKGGALEFHGNDDYVDVGDPAGLNIGYGGSPSTVSAWVKADVVTKGRSYVFDKSVSALNIQATNSYDPKFRAKMWGPSPKSSTSFTSGSWIHIATTWDGVDQGKIYVNGVLEDSDTDSSIGGWDNRDLRISGTGSRSVDGLIDEVAVWNVALTDSEVLEVYNAALAPPDNTTPSVPQNLMSNGSTETTITLSWDASSDPESGIDHYNVYRDNVLVLTPIATNDIDFGLSPGTSYTYEVSAVNGAGLESARSTALVASTLADTLAPTIVNVNATATTVQVVWSEQMDPVTAGNPATYNIPGVTITGGYLLTDGKTAFLTTSDASEFTVTATGAEDLAGNTAPDSETYNILGCFI